VKRRGEYREKGRDEKVLSIPEAAREKGNRLDLPEGEKREKRKG